MDVQGAKALKRRLGPHSADDAPHSSANVAEDAPPVYHWFGVERAAREAPRGAGEDETAAGGRASTD